MGGMRETADDRMWDLLVRVARTQRQRRVWGQDEPIDPPSEEHPGGAEQPSEQET